MENKFWFVGVGLSLALMAVYALAAGSITTQSGDITLAPASGKVFVNGSVGVGTGVPDNRLTVVGGVRVGPAGVPDPAYGNVIGSSTSGQLMVATQNSFGVMLNLYGGRPRDFRWATYYSVSRSNGNIGSEQPLQSGDVIGGLMFIGSTGSGSWAYGAKIDAVPDASWDYGMAAPTALRFSTSDVGTTPIERVRVDHLGNVGVGDLTPDRRLDIGASSINSGDGMWTVESSSAFKHNVSVRKVEGSVLDRWLNVSVYDWSYKPDFILVEMGVNVSRLSVLKAERSAYLGRLRSSSANSSPPLFRELSENLSRVNESISFLESAVAYAERESKVRHRGLMADEFNPVFLGSNTSSLSGDDVMNYLILGLQELKRENNLLKQELCAKDSSHKFCKSK